MATPGQVVQSKKMFHQDDKPVQDLKRDKTQMPASWKLTKQQQDFIDLMTVDDHKKQ
ncbi:hypothetical protein [Enterobacter sp. R1(2018)]|uniref:hypothetical protein n=1 Tax=Enterobacter sp. R1(2018) TaxID=2447891 RepID=UPI001600645D|nr:hypothetical protein [Enterobacter sp. R1(2018)]